MAILDGARGEAKVGNVKADYETKRKRNQSQATKEVAGTLKIAGEKHHGD